MTTHTGLRGTLKRPRAKISAPGRIALDPGNLECGDPCGGAAGALCYAMGGKRARQGQASVEYLLLVCSVVVLIELSGLALKHYLPQLIDRVFELITDAVLALASP